MNDRNDITPEIMKTPLFQIAATGARFAVDKVQLSIAIKDQFAAREASRLALRCYDVVLEMLTGEIDRLEPKPKKEKGVLDVVDDR